MKAKLYTLSYCPFCIRAKEVLRNNGIDFEEEVLDSSPDEMEKLKSKYGHSTVPIVLLDDEFIGGCDDLLALEREGKLVA